jgi:hypothetical protein
MDEKHTLFIFPASDYQRLIKIPNLFTRVLPAVMVSRSLAQRLTQTVTAFSRRR